MHIHRGKGEFGEPISEVFGTLINMIGGAIVKQVPDDLKLDRLRRLESGKPARPIISARRFLDQMPTQTVANRPEAELFALPVVAKHMFVVTCRPDQVQANAVTPPVRRAFKAGLE